MAGEDPLPSDSFSLDHNVFPGSISEFPPLISNSKFGNQTSQNLGFGMDWSNVLATKSQAEDCSLVFKSSNLMEGKKVAAVNSKDFEEAVKDCQNLVIGFFAGKKLSFSMVKDAVAKQWKLKSEVTISTHGDNSNAFVFNFVNEDDRRIALEQGAFFISKQLFIVRPWSLLIEQSIAEMKTIPVWVLIYNVPLHLWNKLGLSVIASYLGNPLMMDECTKKKNRLTYARVCVEIDFDCSFPSVIPLWIDGVHIMDLPIEYQWKPTKCLKCSSFGHKPNSCTTQVGKKKVHWTHKKNQKQQLTSVTNKDVGVSRATNVVGEISGVHSTALNGANADLDGQILKENAEGHGTREDEIPEIEATVLQTHIENQHADRTTTNGKVTEVENLGAETQNIEKQWTYARRTKKLDINSAKSKQVETSYLNPFDVLYQEGEATSLRVGTLENREEHVATETLEEVAVETCEESNEDSEYETDKENNMSSSDENETRKLKTLKDIRRSNMW